MTCLDRFLRRAAWTFLILIAGAHVLIPTHVLAQVDTCTLNTVDSTNDVEETVCLATDWSGELYAWAANDSWADSDWQNWPNGDPYVVGLGTEVQVSDDINGFDFDTGLVENGEASGSVSPTSGATYTAVGSSYECYDPTGTWSSDCNWQGAGGVWVSATMPGSPPPPLSTPTLSLTASGSPSGSGLPLTFTATLSFDATGEDVDFYDNIGYIGSATFSGTAATFTTSALSPGTYSITAYYWGDQNYSAVTSNTIIQVVNNSALPTPTIASLNPSSGTVGLAVNISGSGFGAADGQSIVTFNGAPAGVLNWSDSSITAVVPSTATTGSVVVKLANGQTSNNNVNFTVNNSSCP
jgi:hypothetical protein